MNKLSIRNKNCLYKLEVFIKTVSQKLKCKMLVIVSKMYLQVKITEHSESTKCSCK